MTKRTTRTMIVFTHPGASTNPGGKIVQPRVRFTRAGNPVKYADSLFRSLKGRSIPLESEDDQKVFFESWPTLKELVVSNLAHIETTATEMEEWAAQRPDRYEASSDGDELTAERFAGDARSHARRAMNLIEARADENAVGFDVLHEAMKAVELWGRMVLSIHEPAILAERNIHTKRRTGGSLGAENQKRIETENRIKIRAALKDDVAEKRPLRGRASRIARVTKTPVSTVRDHLEKIEGRGAKGRKAKASVR